MIIGRDKFLSRAGRVLLIPSSLEHLEAKIFNHVVSYKAYPAVLLLDSTCLQ